MSLNDGGWSCGGVLTSGSATPGCSPTAGRSRAPGRALRQDHMRSTTLTWTTYGPG